MNTNNWFKKEIGIGNPLHFRKENIKHAIEGFRQRNKLVLLLEVVKEDRHAKKILKMC